MAVVVGRALVASAPAAAHDQPWLWKEGHLVGCSGGETYSRYVQSVQAMMWAGHFYWFNGNGSSNVDGRYGPNTKRALKDFQNGYGVALIDGCAGAKTWKRLQQNDLLVYQYSDRYNVVNLFRWQRPGYPEYITYDWNSGYTWHFQWFDGWHYVGHGMG